MVSYVALSSADVVPNEMTSSNATQWTTEPGPPGTPKQAGRAEQSGQWSSITYGDGLFVAVSSSGTIATSPNGLSWTERFWRPLDDFYPQSPTATASSSQSTLTRATS